MFSPCHWNQRTLLNTRRCLLESILHQWNTPQKLNKFLSTESLIISRRQISINCRCIRLPFFEMLLIPKGTLWKNALESMFLGSRRKVHVFVLGVGGWTKGMMLRATSSTLSLNDVEHVEFPMFGISDQPQMGLQTSSKYGKACRRSH